METFSIVASGHSCTELIVETNQLRNYLTKSHLQEIENPEKADVVLVSTCSFNQQYEDEAYENITHTLATKQKDSKVLVSGCYPKIAPLTFKKFKDIHAIPPREMEKVEKFVPSDVKIRDILPNSVNMSEYLVSDTFKLGIKLKKGYQTLNRYLPFNVEPSWLDSLPMTDWYFIQGGNGCLGKCTFCAIKYARGRIRSVGIDHIIPQVEIAARRGYKTISFTGTDMGCWGQDMGLSLADLLREVIKVKGDFAIDMHYVEPEWVIKEMDRLEPIFQTGKIKSFGVPVQSGSNRILDLMGRNYRIEEYIDMVNFVVEKTKVKSLSSICMVGFPSETKEDYIQTYELLKKTKISYWCPLKYEARYMVPSEKIEGKVPEDIQINRRDRIERKARLRNYAKFPEIVAERLTQMSYGPII